MNLLKEAMNLVEGTAEYSLSSYQSLVHLRDKARGDEAAKIGRLVESFIAQAPPQTVRQIMSLI